MDLQEKKDYLIEDIKNLIEDFIDEIEPKSLELIKAEHAKECTGIKRTGRTALFCVGISTKSRAAIQEMFESWHQDMRLRIFRIEDVDGKIDKQDVLFLLSENSKWA